MRISDWSSDVCSSVLLAAWVGITGAIHLDGLSDLADARGAAHGDRDKLLTVLADPHVGSFGVTVIVLQLLAKAVLLHATVQVSLPALIFIPFAARIGPLAWSRWLPPLHAGLGARFASSVRRVALAIWQIGRASCRARGCQYG